jgi:hypothetical protein
MYFDPDKKTYYRFPSHDSVQNFDARYYFPEKPYATGESYHYNHITDINDNLSNSLESYDH